MDLQVLKAKVMKIDVQERLQEVRAYSFGVVSVVAQSGSKMASWSCAAELDAQVYCNPMGENRINRWDESYDWRMSGKLQTFLERQSRWRRKYLVERAYV